jgi:hypothetical protein
MSRGDAAPLLGSCRSCSCRRGVVDGEKNSREGGGGREVGTTGTRKALTATSPGQEREAARRQAAALESLIALFLDLPTRTTNDNPRAFGGTAVEILMVPITSPGEVLGASVLALDRSKESAADSDRFSHAVDVTAPTPRYIR